MSRRNSQIGCHLVFYARIQKDLVAVILKAEKFPQKNALVKPKILELDVDVNPKVVVDINLTAKKFPKMILIVQMNVGLEIPDLMEEIVRTQMTI